jgi:hypothetical protein
MLGLEDIPPPLIDPPPADQLTSGSASEVLASVQANNRIPLFIATS